MQKYGFFLTIGRFGAGKTRHITRALSWHRSFMDVATGNAWPKRIIKIANYSTGYTHIQIQSHEDLRNLLFDIRAYHMAYRVFPQFDKIYRLFPNVVKERIRAEMMETRLRWGADLEPRYCFHNVSDEVGVWFNARNFAKNFNGKNEVLQEFITQPRKYGLLWFASVQHPSLVDSNFLRLAATTRFVYEGFRVLWWYKDLHFVGDDFAKIQEAECTWWGLEWNLYPLVKLDYDSLQPVSPWESIYEPGRLFELIRADAWFGKTNPDADYESLVPPSVRSFPQLLAA